MHCFFAHNKVVIKKVFNKKCNLGKGNRHTMVIRCQSWVGFIWHDQAHHHNSGQNGKVH